MTFRTKKASLTLLPALFALSGSAITPALAQTGFLHHHHKMAGLAAGIAAHHMAAHAHGGLMHRHPILTGVAAGMATNHMLKKH